MSQLNVINCLQCKIHFNIIIQYKPNDPQPPLPTIFPKNISSSSYICHGVELLFDPFRSHVSRILFKVLPWLTLILTVKHAKNYNNLGFFYTLLPLLEVTSSTSSHQVKVKRSRPMSKPTPFYSQPTAPTSAPIYSRRLFKILINPLPDVDIQEYTTFHVTYLNVLQCIMDLR
jgi:hypothetical protein